MKKRAFIVTPIILVAFFCWVWQAFGLERAVSWAIYAAFWLLVAGSLCWVFVGDELE